VRAVLELQGGDAAVGIAGDELGCTRFAPGDVQLGALEGDAELRGSSATARGGRQNSLFDSIGYLASRLLMQR
jgi:hypothetical protein